jgi:hypothetical protein
MDGVGFSGAPFIITEAEFLLELLIIALDPRPQLCQVDQAIAAKIAVLRFGRP